jgi:hypothetical protein
MAIMDKIRNTEGLCLREPREDETIPNQFSCYEFGLPDTSKMTEEEQLSYLVDILLDWYFNEHLKKGE